MSSLAIQVEGLSKQYRIGIIDDSPREGVRAITGAFQAPFRYLAQTLRPPTEEEILWALKDINFQVREGEVLGIVGRNGAGKSTLLKILSRITDPSEGRAVLRGRLGSLLEVGTGFHPDLTGRENIYLKGTILGMKKSEIDRKLDEIVEFSEIGRFLDTPVKRYSSGMGVRLGFAVAAHLEPEILIVDEVLAVGDANFQNKCIGKMTGIANTGRTILFVSHNISTILQLCTRALLLENGKVAMDGETIDVVREYFRGALRGEGEMVWSEEMAPGDERFRVRAVRVCDMNGNLAPVVRLDEPFQIVVYYQVFQPNVKFRSAVKFNTQNQLAFTTFEPNETENLAPGIYSTAVTVPAHLLNEGEYVVGVSFFEMIPHKHHFALLKDVLSFQTFDPMTGETSRGTYTSDVGGLVSPRLQWRTPEPDDVPALPELGVPHPLLMSQTAPASLS